MSNTAWTRTGKVVGNGSTKKVVLGFKPKKVDLFNEDSGDSAMKSDTMDGAFAHKKVAAGASTYADNVCTIEDDGFTLGNDADINAADEVIHYVAHESIKE